ncbi:MAG: GAF domain-containing protein [Nitrospirae bacterium]|nr:GAF domain-containing protein [Nitrospirota bacterium]
MSDASLQPQRGAAEGTPPGAPTLDLEILNTLHRISDGTGLSLHERLAAIVKVVAFHLRSDACSIYLEDGGAGSRFLLAATHGLNPEAVGRVSLAPGEGVTGWVGRERIPLPIEDISHDTRFKMISEMGEEGFKAIMAAPIRLDQRLIGVINVQNRAVREYTDPQVRLLETIGIHLGGIIRAAQYYEEARKQLKHQRLVNGIGQALVSTLHLDPLLEMVMEKSRELTQTRGGVLRLWDEERQQLVVRVTTGDMRPEEELRPLYLGEGLSGIAALKQQRWRLDAVARPQERELLPSGVVHNYLCVPVVFQGRSIGTISVFDKEQPGGLATRLTDDDEALLQALANQVAVAIKNAQACDDLTATVEDLKAQRDQLVQAETLAAVGRMADAMAHQLRGPLVPITGLATRLMDGDLSESQRHHYLEVILREAKRMDRFLDGVMELVRAGEVNPEQRDVDAFVAESVERFRPTANGKGVGMRLELNAGSVAWLDSDKLRRALCHVLDNALKALPAGGEIRVRTERCAYPVEGSAVDGVCIQVRDTGDGIPEAMLDSLFKPFISGRDGGRGLGLSTAYRTLRGHGGTLLAHNPPDGGAEFTLFLPESPGRSGAPRSPSR